MWRPSVYGLSVVYNVSIVAKRCILYRAKVTKLIDKVYEVIGNFLFIGPE